MHHLGICGFRLHGKGEVFQVLKLAAAAVESEGEELVCLCSDKGKIYNIEEIFENLEICFQHNRKPVMLSRKRQHFIANS